MDKQQFLEKQASLQAAFEAQCKVTAAESSKQYALEQQLNKIKNDIRVQEEQEELDAMTFTDGILSVRNETYPIDPARIISIAAGDVGRNPARRWDTEHGVIIRHSIKGAGKETVFIPTDVNNDDFCLIKLRKLFNIPEESK